MRTSEGGSARGSGWSSPTASAFPAEFPRMRAQRRIPDGNIRDPAAIVADSGTPAGQLSGGALARFMKSPVVMCCGSFNNLRAVFLLGLLCGFSGNAWQRCVMRVFTVFHFRAVVGVP